MRRPPYRRIAVTGAIAAVLATLGGLRARSYLEGELGLRPESSRARAAWMLERAREFLTCASGTEGIGVGMVGSWRPSPDIGRGFAACQDSPNCALIARRLAREAVELDPCLAEGHLVAAQAAEMGNLPDDVVLAHLDAAIAADQRLWTAGLHRARLLMRRYLVRWLALETHFLGTDEQLRNDAELEELRRQILCDLPYAAGNCADEYEVYLRDRIRELLSSDDSPESEWPGLNVSALARLIQSHPGSSPSVREVGRQLNLFLAEWADPSIVDERALSRAQRLAWETNWWYTRWPSYGTQPHLEALATDMAGNVTRSAFTGVPWWRGEARLHPVGEAAEPPRDGVSIAREAETLEAQGRFLHALERANEAVRLLCDAPGVRLIRARIHEDLLEIHEARRDYDDAVRLGKGRPEFLRVRAAFLLQTGRADEALVDARLAAATNSSPISQALVGDALIATGRAQEVLDTIAGRVYPIGGMRCRALRALGRLEEAAEESFRVDDPVEEALSSVALGRTRNATRAVEVSVQDDGMWWSASPTFTQRNPQMDIAALFETCARIFMQLGQHQRVLQALDEAIILQPMRAEAHALRAEVLLKLDRRSQASASARRGLLINPRNAYVWKAHGRVLEAEGQIKEAEEAYAKAASLDNNDMEAKACLGRLRAQLPR